MTGSTSLPWAVSRAVLIGLGLVAACMPFLVLFLNGLRPADEFLSDASGLVPSRLTLDNYAIIFDARAGTLDYLVNSLVVTTATTILSVAIGAMAAYALSRARLPFRLSHVIATVFLMVRFYPKIAVAIPYYLMMRDAHLLDTRTAIVIAHVSIAVPFVVWLLLAFFEEFPREIERAAMLDGCGPIRRFVLVVLPLSTPSLVTAAILTAFLSWNEFLMASAVGPVYAKTLPVRIASFITDKGTQWGPMSAMSTIIVLPVMAFALLTQRYLVRGLTAGAVKG